MKKQLLFLVLMMLPMVASATSQIIDGIYYNLDAESQTAEVAFNRKNPFNGDVVIPATVTFEEVEYSVTGIEARAFMSRSSLTSVVLPNSLKTIGNLAFARSSNLSSINIPDGVTSIGEQAFQNCTALTSIVIPNSVTTIGEEAFRSCSGLTSVTIGNGLTSIDQFMFYSCTSLTDVTIGSGVENIDEQAFYGCDNITKVVLNSPGIVSKDYSEERSISNLFGWKVKEYEIGDGVRSIGDNAFWNCFVMTSITLSNDVTRIGKSAFYNCYALTSINLPDGMETIGEGAFGYCKGLTAIDIPNSVKKIGKYAFYCCKGLTSVIIPENVDSIGEQAFLGCENLESITISDRTIIGAQAFNATAWFEAQPDGMVYLGGYLYAYKGQMPENTTIDVKEGTLRIMDRIFSYYYNIVAVHFPNSLTDIGQSAFYGCTKLTSIHIPTGVTHIGENAFNDCSGLTSITVDEGNAVYDSRENCNGIIETASNRLIKGIKNTTIPHSVTKIGPWAFSYCMDLTSVSIPNVTIIEEYAFSDCAALTSVELGDKLTEIGNGAFWACTGLTSIDIPQSVTTIGSFSFSQCTSLPSIVIPNSVTAIYDGAFAGCTSLSTVVVGAGIRNIYYATFKGCSSLTDMYCYAEEVLETNFNYSFEDSNYKNATLHVPASVLEAYKSTEPWYEFASIVALTDSDPNPTGIKSVSNSAKAIERYYTIDGKLLSAPQRGLNIIKMSDGKTRKVVIK